MIFNRQFAASSPDPDMASPLISMTDVRMQILHGHGPGPCPRYIVLPGPICFWPNALPPSTKMQDTFTVA
jgi:hypothetical protein